MENKDEILLALATILKLSLDFTNQSNNSSFVRLQGFLSLQRQLFTSDPAGEDIWIYFAAFGQQKQIDELKANLSKQRVNQKLLLSKLENLSDEEEVQDEERRKFMNTGKRAGQSPGDGIAYDENVRSSGKLLNKAPEKKLIYNFSKL